MLKVRTKKTKSRVEYVVEGEKKAVFWLEPLTKTEIREIVDKSREVEWDAPDEGGQKQRFVDYNPYVVMVGKAIKACVGWEDIVDEAGNELDCNEENKATLFEYNASVLSWINDELAKINTTHLDQESASEKN